MKQTEKIYRKHWNSWVEKVWGKDASSDADFEEIADSCPHIYDAMEEHASNELASYKAELSKLIDSCNEYEFVDGDWYHKDDGDGANPIKTLTLLALLEDNPTN